MTGHSRLRSGRRAAAAALLLPALLLSGCTSSPAPARRPERVAAVRPAADWECGSAAVDTAARRFMDAMVSRDWAGQWRMLSDGARATWPSPQARAEMLSRKYNGAARVSSYRLGTGVSQATWVSHVTLQSHSAVCAVPVTIALRDAGHVGPAGVTADLARLALRLEHGPNGAWTVVDEGPAAVDAPVIEPALPVGQTVHAPVLMYHLVQPVPARAAYTSEAGWRLDAALTVTPAAFASQMAALDSAGYTAIAPPVLADAVLYGLPLPPRPVLITFDDGRLSPWQYAVPVLMAHHFTAAFFLCAGLLGWQPPHPPQYMTTSEVSRVSAMGFWVEDHTMADNVPLWGAPTPVLAALAVHSRQILQRMSTTAIQMIAYSGVYPFDSAAQTGPAENVLFAQLAQWDYVAGLLDQRTPSTLVSAATLWRIPRLRPGQVESGAQLLSALAAAALPGGPAPGSSRTGAAAAARR